MLGAALDDVGQRIAHEAVTSGRRGAGTRTQFAVLAGAVAFTLTTSPWAIGWLLAVLLWEWAATPVAVDAIRRHLSAPSEQLNAQVIMTGVGATLFALFPFLIFPDQGTLGATLAATWLFGSMMHAVTYLGVDRSLLTVGLAPIAIACAALPWLQWGWAWQTALSCFAMLCVMRAAIDFSADSNRFVDVIARTSATLQAASDTARTRAQILSMTTHEWRTPLNAIRNYAELLALDSPPDSERLKDAQRIVDASAKLLGLLNRSIEISRIDAGQVEITRTATDVEELVADACTYWSKQAANGRNEFISVVAGLGVASIDGPKLRQCLDCLLENACKFTSDGRITLSVARAGSVLVFSIQDTGSGISEKTRLTMFEPLQQGDMTAARRFEGSGLGLALVDRLVKLMGGVISVDSTPGQGSTFKLQIPVLDD